MNFIWRLLTGCDWQESLTELRHYYSSHRKRIWLLLLGIMAVTLAVRLLNKCVGPLPAIPNPTMAEIAEISGNTHFYFEFLLFVAVVAVMLLLPPTASYPVDVARITSLPRKIYCLLLSIPLGLSYAMETRFVPYYLPADWLGNAVGLLLPISTVLIPTAVLASFLDSVKLSRRFKVAASAWVLCHVAVSVVEWHRFPFSLMYLPVSSIRPLEMIGHGTLLAAQCLLVWHQSRWMVFVTGCFLVVFLYLFHWSMTTLLSGFISDAGLFAIFWALDWLSAGATWIFPTNWTWIV